MGVALMAAALAAGVSAASAGLTAAGPAGATPAAMAIELPAAGSLFDYQLGGASPVPAGASLVVRDSTDKPAEGAYGVCYVNGFQTQPGVRWPAKLLVRRKDGRLLVDPGWPDEHLFDLSKAGTRAAVAKRLGRTIRACAAAGYQAVEFDNLDSWTRSRKAFDKSDAVAFARALVADAHAEGLAAAQKNTAELGAVGRTEIGFDFAITEECDRFRECPAFTRVYGGRVFDIEYAGALRGTRAKVCSRLDELDPRPSAIVRDRDLVPRGKPGYAYTAC